MKFTLPQRPAAEVDLFPAILIAVLLFFLIPVVSAQMESQERARLPRGGWARPPAASADNLLVIRISEQGGVQIAGDDIPADALAAALQRERQLLPAGVSNAEASVLIRAERKAPGGRIQEVVKAAQEARFGKFLLQVRPDAAAAPRKESLP